VNDTFPQREISPFRVLFGAPGKKLNKKMSAADFLRNNEPGDAGQGNGVVLHSGKSARFARRRE
jgi:hypothetical protein